MSFLAKEEVVFLPRSKNAKQRRGKKVVLQLWLKLQVPAQRSKTMKLCLDWQNSLVWGTFFTSKYEFSKFKLVENFLTFSVFSSVSNTLQALKYHSQEIDSTEKAPYRLKKYYRVNQSPRSSCFYDVYLNKLHWSWVVWFGIRKFDKIEVRHKKYYKLSFFNFYTSSYPFFFLFQFLLLLRTYLWKINTYISVFTAILGKYEISFQDKCLSWCIVYKKHSREIDEFKTSIIITETEPKLIHDEQ